MKRLVIDCAQFPSQPALHRYLKEQFVFPDYYGNNLDALFDCLTDLNDPVCLCVQHSQTSGAFSQALLDTLRDAAQVNPKLLLEWN